MFDSHTAKELVIAGAARAELLSWFDTLQERNVNQGARRINGRAWRAEMRRATPPYGVLACSGFHALHRALAEHMTLMAVDELALALFATVAVHVKWHNSSASFAAQLGESRQGRPCMSTLRFRRLQQSDSPDAFCHQLIQAVRLRGNDGANVVSLADGVLLWMREYQEAQQPRRPVNVDPFRHIRIRWANEYLSTAR